MAFIKRDTEGKICALVADGTPDAECVEFDNPELILFISRCDSEKKFQMIQSDLQLIRVIEDLVNVLIDKHIITITDFPPVVIQKLLARQDIRKRLSFAIGMEFGEDEK